MLGLHIPNRLAWREFDWLLLGLAYALMAFGLVTLLGCKPASAMRQMQWVCIGTGALLFCLFVDAEFLKKFAPFFYVVGLVLLAMVLSTTRIKGARSWFEIGGVSFQPSEPAKIAVVLMIARILSKRAPLTGGNLVPGLLQVGLVSGLALGLVAAQPDLGTASVFVLTVAAMLWVGGLDRRMMLALFLWGALTATAAFPYLKTYQKARITIFLNPESDPRGAGYQLIQARIAQGSGRIWGKGFGKGTQTDMRFLPEFDTDFIFSSVGEQFGLAGSLAAIGLFLAFMARAYRMARKAHDPFAAHAIVGLATIIAAHVALNLGMSLGLLPVTGLPLPFFSYGGSFLLTVFLTVGLMLNLKMRRFMF